MGAVYDALNGEAKLAVDWKARQNMNMALAGGSEMALANQNKFLENNRESLASNPVSLRQIIREYKDFLSTIEED